MSKQSAIIHQRGFASYGKYVVKLRDLAGESRRATDWDARAIAALNGQASLELRRIISLKTRRRFGAFFTGSELSTRLISRCSKFDQSSIIYDPSVGMGNLLIAAARKLPLGRSLNETLKRWGCQLTGTDIHPKFVEGAKTRLVILAQQRHGLKSPSITSIAGLFPGIRIANGLAQHKLFARATHLTLNPPFVITDAPEGCKWAGGRITAAANFVVTALERAKSGAELVAILPDVLRSGSFTEKWRNRIEELAAVKLVKPYGIFDESADVDVFILRVKRRAKNSAAKSVPWTSAPAKIGTTVADYFDVHVGRVVPHRDPKKGEKHPYIHARCVPTWEIMREFKESRRYQGKVYKPPFVAIRRTSRPGHLYRAAATVIAGKKSLAVENHLIVCEPNRKKTQAMCKKLMLQLQTKAVNEFLDERIRCRHLTVGAVAAIPFQI
jgi:N-6 DNA Methylase